MTTTTERPTHIWIIGFKLNQEALDSLADRLKKKVGGRWKGHYSEDSGCSLIEYTGRRMGVERYSVATAFVEGYKASIFDFHKW